MDEGKQPFEEPVKQFSLGAEPEAPPAPPGPPDSPDSIESDDGTPQSDERTWAIIAHLLGAITVFIAPLIIYLIKKDESAYVEDQAKEALNFQITISIAYLVCGALSFLCIGLFLFPVVGLLDVVLSIVAALKANDGVRFRYPAALRLVR